MPISNCGPIEFRLRCERFGISVSLRIYKNYFHDYKSKTLRVIYIIIVERIFNIYCFHEYAIDIQYIFDK